MTNEGWRAAWKIYREACDLADAERRSFVESRLSDPALRQRVFALLDGLDSPTSDASQPLAGMDTAAGGEPTEVEWSRLGQTIGRFALTAPVGRGGMGEVYAARDPELNRMVALKLVSRGNLGTVSAVDRFIREAQSASALNHPGIVTVHEVIRSGPSVAIVMELVDGVSFRALCGTAHTAAQVADWGRQVAQALAAAHAAQIVHRDIKPDNLVLRPDNLVKILDFGIARDLSHPDALDGIPLGTLGYMAPEQIGRAALTSAADIFSLGVILYELATGAHPFLAKTASETTRAIALLDPNPRRIARPPLLGHSDLERLILAMLAKDPNQRPDAAAVAVRLEKIARRPEGGIRARTVRLAVPILIGALGIAAWWATGRPQPDRAPPVVKQFTTLDGSEVQPSFSPDGRKIAFSWDGTDGVNRDIYVQDIGGDAPVRLTSDPAEDSNPVWSPDGTQIAFLRKSVADSSQFVMVMSAQGGDERQVGQITEFEHFYAPLAWWPDGRSLIVREQSQGTVGFLRLIFGTGEKRPLTIPPGTSRDSNAAVSPDGRRFAFVRRDGTSLDDICIAPLPEGNEVPKPECVLKAHNIRDVVWWHGGKQVLYTKDNAIWRAPADASAARKETKVLDGSLDDLAADRQNRLLAIARSTTDPNVWRVDRNGRGRVKLIASSRPESDASYSPDGERILFRSSRTGNYELWTTDKEGAHPSRLTDFGSGSLGSARWSPDGRQIVFDGYNPKFEHTNNTNVFVISAGGGQIRRVTDDQAIYGVPNWSHDGRWIYYFKRLGSGRETWKIPSEGGTPVLVSRGMMFDVAESADGKYLYYTTQLDAGGIWRRPVEGGEPTRLPGTERVQTYRYWQLTPQGIYFVEGPANPVVQFLNFKSGRVTHLASIGSQMLRTPRGLAVSPDGKFILYLHEDAKQSDLYLIEDVQ
jgi:serine/threonine protein kinase